MKAGLIWSLVLWIAIVLEQSRPDIFPSAALLFPFAAGCLLWIGNSTGVVLTGIFLIVSNLLRPAIGPLELASILLPATWLLTRTDRNRKWTAGTSRQRAWPAPILITLAGLVTHTAGVTGLNWSALGPALMTRILMATPCVLLIVGLLRVSEEFGFRRLNTRP